MRNVYFLLCALLTLFFFQTNSNAQGSCADGAYQWSDIATIFENNGCATAACHGGAASGLDLTTFAGFNTGGAKCETEISSGTTLVDIIQVGGVVCANGMVTSAMNSFIANPLSTDDIDAIQAYIDGGSFEFCAGTPLDDGVCDPATTIGSLAAPGQTTLCSDGSDAPTFTLPTASLPDVQIVIEINGVLTIISDDGSFDTSTLMEGDEVCYTAFTFDLAAINELLTTASTICPIIDCDAAFDIPGVNQAIDDLVSGANDGNPGLNDLQEALDFAGSFGNPIGSVQTAGSTLDALNAQIGDLLGNVCYATSEAICLSVIDCGPDCPTVVNVIPTESVCHNFTSPISFCVEFDMIVDANTVLTVEGVIMDGSAGGTQICVDFIPYIPLLDPCSSSTIFYTASVICDGTDLLEGIVWPETQILPITDPACGSAVVGCLDNTACNYNPNADCDDGSCMPAPTCNTNPCLGDVEIIDPNDACVCIVDQVQVFGCTNPDATNYNPAANCDDGSCIVEMCTDPCAPNFGANEACEPYDMTCNTDCLMGDIEIWDPVGCVCVVDTVVVIGCTDSMANNYDPNANCDDGSCIFSNPGCTDPCADNYDPDADLDDGSCEPYDMTCNTDCLMGDIEIWDPVGCVCVVDTVVVIGCTDSMANNYDPNANCDDGSCIFSNPGCTDPCADNYDPDADLDDGSCNPYDMTCNDDCSTGPFGGSWDPGSCSCINQITPVDGCTDETASNYNPDANCDDGSCFCEEEIVGSIIVPDEGCDVSGLEVMIMAPDGTSITVITDANGSFTVPGGPFPCGIYAATITDANVPACFTDSGNIGPIQFEVDGQGNGNDGPFFIANPDIPTLSQWGLMILALLLMTFGALKIASNSINLSFYPKK